MLTVAADDAGRRIDNFLASRLKDVPRSRIYRMLRSGEVRVNGARAQPDRRLAAADRIRIPPLLRAAPEQGPPIPAAACQALAGAVRYEDEHLLVVDKPAGMAVHSGSGLAWGLIDAMRALRPHAPMLELVHRIDRDTSGCLALAKDMPTLRELHARLRAGTLGKRYLALVRGRWPARLRSIRAPLRRTAGGQRESAVQVDAQQGRAAETRVLAVRSWRQASLLELELLTGRTHQIRVHAAACGHPLAGDRKYGDPDFNRAMAELGLRRMFLHAAELLLPRAGQAPIRVSAPLPAELAQVLDALRD